MIVGAVGGWDCNWGREGVGGGMDNNAEQSRFPLPPLRPRPAFIRAWLCAKDVGRCVHLLTFLSPFACERPTREMSPFFPPPSFTKRKLMQVLFRRRRGGQKEGKLFVKKEGENRKEVATIFQRPNFLRKAKVFLKKGRTSIPFCPRKELYRFIFVFFTKGKSGKHLFFACY